MSLLLCRPIVGAGNLVFLFCGHHYALVPSSSCGTRDSVVGLASWGYPPLVGQGTRSSDKGEVLLSVSAGLGVIGDRGTDGGACSVSIAMRQNLRAGKVLGRSKVVATKTRDVTSSVESCADVGITRGSFGDGRHMTKLEAD